ncbi:glycerophosphodiester phosphodiesterase family protein [Paraglaciecola aquimarina]|uniref:Glycerophosphodiester phosphodiesterase family protein n=1 Tax=Paraglaciecola aquimarina TaxID=1235557 RepID=A0ABU3T1V3_9ALTE|nr:glycerophosphodiester phosphodiesterase family protein [Paraglaciecola aquimarina]MDU0356249.1 glycerophosphodiester phosphodiesterase family protein [Paraglaciecola aquimarina]
MLVFAHRGASADAPENTLAAIEEALKQQADGIEVDIQQVDQEFIVFHDREMSRRTNGTGLLKDYSLSELQALDAGQGQNIPTLWQLLEAINGRCLVNLELKRITDVALLHDIIDQAIQSLNFTAEQFIISSFDHHLLLATQQLAPHIKIAALTASKPVEYAAFAQSLNAYSVNVDMTCLDQHFVQDAKRRGLKIMVYTVDEPKELLQLKEWQVDGVFSNSPQRSLQILRT